MDFSLLPKMDRVLEEVEKVITRNIENTNVIKKCSKESKTIFLKEKLSKAVLTDSARKAICSLRKDNNNLEWTRDSLLKKAVEETLEIYRQEMEPKLCTVLNATGVVLHTNLGRAPLPPYVAERVAAIAQGYCNLELNLAKGKRGSRYDHVRELLCSQTGAEEALVVNNNAAAVMVVLDTLAQGGEAIVSRGQLVEIGGSFRIPEVIERAKAVLKEVGATNKTHLKDYEKAIGDNTTCLLQVHPSNYHMTGFVEEVATSELASLAHAHKLPLIYDLGSGCLFPFKSIGVGTEPLPFELLKAEVDVLTFSGDKLLGGPQAGIIVGKKKYLEPIMHNPLLRALRVDKMTLGALEATLELYRDGREREIPTIAMLTASKEELKTKALAFLRSLVAAGISAAIVERKTPVGGGSMPEVELDSFVVEVESEKERSLEAILAALRESTPAVLAYIHDEHICFDTRTIADSEMEVLGKVVKEVLV